MYIIVEDLNPIKSKNKERDDYICFLFNTYFQNKNKCVCVISNDKFKNYNNIINNIKPVKLHFINTQINTEFLQELYSLSPKKDLNRIGFRFN